MAKEMDVEKATAAWVIRDVTIGRDCEFSPVLALAQMIPSMAKRLSKRSVCTRLVPDGCL